MVEATIKHIDDRAGMAVYEERNGDFGVLSFCGGASVDVDDIVRIDGKTMTNLRSGRQTRIVIEDHGMYYEDAVSLIEKMMEI